MFKINIYFASQGKILNHVKREIYVSEGVFYFVSYDTEYGMLI